MLNKRLFHHLALSACIKGEGCLFGGCCNHTKHARGRGAEDPGLWLPLLDTEGEAAWVPRTALLGICTELCSLPDPVVNEGSRVVQILASFCDLCDLGKVTYILLASVPSSVNWG